MTRAGLITIASLVFFATRVAAVTCPENKFQFDCSGCPTVTSSMPTGTVDLIGCSVVPWQSGQPCPSSCYDIPHGRIEVHWIPVGGTSRCDRSIAARDTLGLAGPPGPAVSFEAVLQVHCTIVNGGSAVAALSPGGPLRQYSASADEELVLPLSVVPGSWFGVEYAVAASNASPCCVSGSGGADITGDLRFRGLPAGYSLYSCRGFFAPVPASATSWGRMKAAYR